MLFPKFFKTIRSNSGMLQHQLINYILFFASSEYGTFLDVSYSTFSEKCHMDKIMLLPERFYKSFDLLNFSPSHRPRLNALAHQRHRRKSELHPLKNTTSQHFFTMHSLKAYPASASETDKRTSRLISYLYKSYNVF